MSAKPYIGQHPEHDLHEFNLDRHNREIYLSGEEGVREDLDEPGVEHTMALRFIRNIRLLACDGKDPILIHMKSCGGEEQEGLAIYDALRLCPCKTTVLSYTHARSMSSIILQGADRRLLMPSGYMMLHLGTVVYQGEVRTVQSNIEFFLKYYADLMFDIYAKRMKQSARWKASSLKRIKEHLRELIKEKGDLFLTPKVAVLWGLADAVFDGKWGKLK